MKLCPKIGRKGRPPGRRAGSRRTGRIGPDRRAPFDRARAGSDGRVKLYADVAHPINSECREVFKDAVVEAFERECERTKDTNTPRPTVTANDDFFDDDY